MGLLSWSGDITDGYVCNIAATSRCFLIETAPLKAGIDLHEWRAYFLKRGIQNTILRRLNLSAAFFNWRPSAVAYWEHIIE